MERKVLKKIVYEDNQQSKVLRGYILNEDEFCFEVMAERTGDFITIGKRAIIKICEVGDSDDRN